MPTFEQSVLERCDLELSHSRPEADAFGNWLVAEPTQYENLEIPVDKRHELLLRGDLPLVVETNESMQSPWERYWLPANDVVCYTEDETDQDRVDWIYEQQAQRAAKVRASRLTQQYVAARVDAHQVMVDGAAAAAKLCTILPRPEVERVTAKYVRREIEQQQKVYLALTAQLQVSRERILRLQKPITDTELKRVVKLAKRYARLSKTPMEEVNAMIAMHITRGFHGLLATKPAQPIDYQI